MVLSYNSRLLPMEQKGLCGDPELFESKTQLTKKIKDLVDLIENSSYTVAFTGAGISTSCGIADFRGPDGVWTKELSGISTNPMDDTATCFEQAQPSFTHNALVEMIRSNKLNHVISQNVDGLHLRSGISPEHLTELHGNIFIETCPKCKTNYFRNHDVGGMGLKPTGNLCDNAACGGLLIDNAIDWDTPLPEFEFKKAALHLNKATLVICLGTSLRIRPAGNLPLKVLKANKQRDGAIGHLVVVNLQRTHVDKRARLRISHDCDEVMRKVCEQMGITVGTGSNSSGGGGISTISSSSSRNSSSSGSSFGDKCSSNAAFNASSYLQRTKLKRKTNDNATTSKIPTIHKKAQRHVVDLTVEEESSEEEQEVVVEKKSHTNKKRRRANKQSVIDNISDDSSDSGSEIKHTRVDEDLYW